MTDSEYLCGELIQIDAFDGTPNPRLFVMWIFFLLRSKTRRSEARARE